MQSKYLTLTALAALALVSACATGGQDDEAAARAACQEQNTPADEMSRCIAQAMEDIRQARDHIRNPPPQPRPQPPR